MRVQKRETKKYVDYTPEDIKRYLDVFKKLIVDNRYVISINENRQENIEFIEEYRIDSKKEKEIFLGIQYNDFCYAVDNEKDEYNYERLYVFCKELEIDYWGQLEFTEIYIKTNVTKTRRGDKYVVVISFHKRNYPMTYLFK